MGRTVEQTSAGLFHVTARIVGDAATGGEYKRISDLPDPHDVDVVIDFSAPAALVEAAMWCGEHGIPLVSGTTGMSAEQLGMIEAVADETALLLASNFSVGVNLLERLVELSAASSRDWDIEILEAHHRRKVDAPSGTALTLGKAAARGRNVDLDAVVEWGRHRTMGPRGDDEIGFQVMRGGTIVGEHTVFMCGEGERIELTHRAEDRAIFARGALRAAKWIIGRGHGRYTMADVLFSS